MAEVMTAIPESIYELLQQAPIVQLCTIDADNGSPSLNAISWVYAPDKGRLRFAVDGRSRIIDNVRSHAQVSVSVFGAGSLYALNGKATIVTESLEDVPFKLCCIDIAIETVRDAMFYGARISVMPEYEKTYDQRAAAKLDGQVFDAMRKA